MSCQDGAASAGADQLHPSPSKKAKVSQGKAKDTIGCLVGSLRQHDDEEKLGQLMKQFRESPELIDVARAAIKAHLSKKRAASTTLRRGVAQLKDIPHYLVIEALSKTLKVDASIFSKKPTSENKNLLIYMLRGHKKYKLPKLQMTLEEFHTWIAQRYEAMGSILKDVSFRDGSIDWEFEVGTYNFEDPCEDEVIKSVRNTVTNVIAELPGHLLIKKCSVGSQWVIEDNFEESAAMIKDYKTGLQQPVQALFKEGGITTTASTRGPRASGSSTGPTRTALQELPSALSEMRDTGKLIEQASQALHDGDKAGMLVQMVQEAAASREGVDGDDDGAPEMPLPPAP